MVDAIAVAVVTPALMEACVAVPAVAVLHVAIAVAMVVAGLTHRARVEQVVDEEPLALICGVREALASTNPEENGIHGSALISRGAGTAARFHAPAEVVLPGCAGVAIDAVDVDLDDVVATTVDEVH